MYDVYREALREADEGTVLYMIEEREKEIEEQKKTIKEQEKTIEQQEQELKMLRELYEKTLR